MQSIIDTSLDTLPILLMNTKCRSELTAYCENPNCVQKDTSYVGDTRTRNLYKLTFLL